MFFNSKAVGILLAVLIALITTAFLSLMPNVELKALGVTAIISFASAFILIYISLQFLIFREINNIYKNIDRIKKNSFKVPVKLKRSANPLRRVNEDILAYADKKQREIEELKELEIFRREFIADVSHELKTPLFAAQGFVLTLLDGAMDDEAVRYKFLRKAAKSLDGLNILVQDLLTLSQIESGHISMKKETFDIRAVTEEVFDQLEENAFEKEIELSIEPTEYEPVFVKGDAMRIAQVMTNLIGNAVKYSPESSVINVKFLIKQDMIQTTVVDNGTGIPPEHIKRIFERFYRVDKSRSKKQGGTGLGLAIVKHIIEKHGSEILVKSKVGSGTSFKFLLPKG